MKYSIEDGLHNINKVTIFSVQFQHFSKPGVFITYCNPQVEYPYSSYPHKGSYIRMYFLTSYTELLPFDYLVILTLVDMNIFLCPYSYKKSFHNTTLIIISLYFVGLVNIFCYNILSFGSRCLAYRNAFIFLSSCNLFTFKHLYFAIELYKHVQLLSIY